MVAYTPLEFEFEPKNCLAVRTRAWEVLGIENLPPATIELHKVTEEYSYWIYKYRDEIEVFAECRREEDGRCRCTVKAWVKTIAP